MADNEFLSREIGGPSKPQARQPRGLVRINGQAVTGWTEWEVENNTFYQADTFRVDFVASSLPKERNVDWWSHEAEIFVELFGGFPSDPENYTAADLTRWIYGRVDHYEYAPVANVLTVTGRDLTSYFIDTKTTEEWKNLTSSQIATQLAQRHGLTPVVKPTTEKVGAYYQTDHVMVTNRHSEWDLLSYLASNEEFVVYVEGQELHFEPRPDPAQAVPYVLRWQAASADQAHAQANFEPIGFDRDLTVAKGVVVWVQWANSKTKKTGSVAYPQSKAKGTAPGQASPHAQVYTERLRGKEQTPAAALRYAQARHRQITQHELKVRVTLPGDNDLTIRNVIQMRGTSSAHDQTYYPDAITRRLSVHGGYEMHVTAKNIAKMNEGVL